MLPRQLLVPVVTATFLMAVPGLASASWNTSGSGKAAAKGATLSPPSFSTDTCSGKGPSTVSLAWPAVTNATAYRVEKSTDGSTYTTVSASTTTRTFSESTTLNGKNKDLYVRVTSIDLTWTSVGTVSHHFTDNGSNCI
jgi:fibronectin type 3 domain-containing protein